MATEFMDNFWCYGIGGQARMLNGAWADNGGAAIAADPDPSAGGTACLKIFPNNGQDVMARRVLSAPQGTVGVAARYWLDNLPPDASRRPCFAIFRDAANVTLCYVTLDPSGYLQAWQWNNGNPLLIGQSNAPVFLATAWQHIESKVTFSNAGGTVEVRVEGVTQLTANAQITSWNGNLCQNAGPGYLRSVGTIGPPNYVKDLIIWNGSGAINSSFWGPCQVLNLLPNADVALGPWAPSTGASGYALIDQSPPQDDAGYIAATANGTAKFALGDLPANTLNVLAVAIVNRSRKSDSGDGTLQNGILSGATTGNGLARALSTAYAYYFDAFDQDPNGNINWSPAAVNALDLTPDRTA